MNAWTLIYSGGGHQEVKRTDKVAEASKEEEEVFFSRNFSSCLSVSFVCPFAQQKKLPFSRSPHSLPLPPSLLLQLVHLIRSSYFSCVGAENVTLMLLVGSICQNRAPAVGVEGL